MFLLYVVVCCHYSCLGLLKYFDSLQISIIIIIISASKADIYMVSVTLLLTVSRHTAPCLPGMNKYPRLFMYFLIIYDNYTHSFLELLVAPSKTG